MQPRPTCQWPQQQALPDSGTNGDTDGVHSAATWGAKVKFWISLILFSQEILCPTYPGLEVERSTGIQREKSIYIYMAGNVLDKSSRSWGGL